MCLILLCKSSLCCSASLSAALMDLILRLSLTMSMTSPLRFSAKKYPDRLSSDVTVFMVSYKYKV